MDVLKSMKCDFVINQAQKHKDAWIAPSKSVGQLGWTESKTFSKLFVSWYLCPKKLYGKFMAVHTETFLLWNKCETDEYFILILIG